MLDREFIVNKIAEMQSAKDQHLANANAAEGARVAFVQMLEEMDKPKEPPTAE